MGNKKKLKLCYNAASERNSLKKRSRWRRKTTKKNENFISHMQEKLCSDDGTLCKRRKL